MNDHVTSFKLIGLNAGSWMATIVSMQATKDVLQIACLLASFAVSAFSIWWIRRQADALEAKQKSEKQP